MSDNILDLNGVEVNEKFSQELAKTIDAASKAGEDPIKATNEFISSQRHPPIEQ